jgi:hypothetical protein
VHIRIPCSAVLTFLLLAATSLHICNSASSIFLPASILHTDTSKAQMSALNSPAAKLDSMYEESYPFLPAVSKLITSSLPLLLPTTKHPSTTRKIWTLNNDNTYPFCSRCGKSFSVGWGQVGGCHCSMPGDIDWDAKVAAKAPEVDTFPFCPWCGKRFEMQGCLYSEDKCLCEMRDV